jgi:hypothetical protein
MHFKACNIYRLILFGKGKKIGRVLYREREGSVAFNDAVSSKDHPASVTDERDMFMEH